MNNLLINRLSFSALAIVSLFVFVSFSITAGNHIFLLVPGFYLMWKSYKNKTLALPKSSWSLLLLVLFSTLSVFLNYDEIERPLRNISKLKYFIFGVIGIFAYEELFKNFLTEKRKKILLNLFLFGATLATLAGLYALVTQYHPLRMKTACHKYRACGMYGMYMSYGYGISLFTVLLTGMLFFKKKISLYTNYYFLVFCFLSNLAGLIYSYARGGWIGYALSLPFFFIIKKKKWFLVSILSIGFIGAGTYLFVPRVQKLFTRKIRIYSNKIRLQQWQAAFYSFKKQPILGMGYKNFEPNSLRIKTKELKFRSYFGGHAHNNFIEHLATTGILGFIAILLFHIFWFLEAFKYRDDISFLILPFIMSLFISGQTQYTMGDGENLFLIMTVYSLSVAYWRSEYHEIS